MGDYISLETQDPHLKSIDDVRPTSSFINILLLLILAFKSGLLNRQSSFVFLHEYIYIHHPHTTQQIGYVKTIRGNPVWQMALMPNEGLEAVTQVVVSIL